VPSTFTWLDTSESDRRKALDVIDLFSLGFTVDQLGFGGIRDAWADLLSPGTSTVQSRARYFLFVPWIYSDLERRGRKGDIERRARRAELELVDAIERTEPGQAPIGTQVGWGLKRLPSSIYWGGLGRLRVRLFEGSQLKYHQALGRGVGPMSEVGEEDAPPSPHWNPHVPPAPEDFPERATLRMRREDAEFLREQVRQHARGSLLQFLVDAEGEAEDVDSPWEHPLVGDMPAGLRNWLGHARLFSLATQGATLVYNLMLAQRLPHEPWVAEHDGRIAEWAGRVRAAERELATWNRAEFWAITRRQNPRIPLTGQAFADRWIDRLIAAAAPEALAQDDQARSWIEEREGKLKGPRSRLRHREHLVVWRGRSGVEAMNYRWGITQRIVADVCEGLRSD
jgi:hypothetical protein